MLLGQWLPPPQTLHSKQAAPLSVVTWRFNAQGHQSAGVYIFNAVIQQSSTVL